MAKKLTTFLLCISLALLCLFAFLPIADADGNTAATQSKRTTLDPNDGGLHTIYELNCEPDELDSHSGVTDVSTLELDYRNSYFIKNSEMIDSGTLWYSRIKRLSSGEYILFFQDGKHGPNIYYTRSQDGYNWDKPTILFAKHSTYNDRYWRYYATCDAIELENGNIVVAAIFHASRKTSADVPSRWLMSEKGIVTKLSRDGGDTWTDQQVIYNGRCWEPSLLQLPDGTVQMYFTQSAPKDAAYTTAMGSHVSSGVGLISSRDNGETWSPIVTSAPYVTSRIVQQYLYTNENGIPIMTDQMPVAILLHDKKTIVMAVESLTAFGSVHNTSIIRSHDFFATKLEENETGPYDRKNMLLPGPAPYIVQFPSGEIAVSNTKKVYLGNELGTEFYTDRSFNLYPHQSTAIWGDLFVGDSHVLLASASDTQNGIGISRLILNHRIDAKTASICVDADTSDWYDNTDALFVGSIKQAQTSIRAAHDSENLYFLFEHLDYYVTSDDTFVFTVADESTGVKITVSADTDGITKIERTEKNKTTLIQGYAAKTMIYGTRDLNSDNDEGVVIEFSIPKSYLGNVSSLRVHMKMYGNDGGETFAWDGFNGLTSSKLSTWHIVRLSDEAALEKPTSAPDTDSTDTTTQSAPVTTQGVTESTSADSAPTDATSTQSPPVTTQGATGAASTDSATTDTSKNSVSNDDESGQSPSSAPIIAVIIALAVAASAVVVCLTVYRSKAKK